MTKEVQRWADAAMFKAEPMSSQTPTVHLLSMSADPLGEIASAAKMYKGEVVRSLSEITDDERLSYFEDMTKTVLGAPFETVKFHFLLEGVTRGFTHQLVRQRTAVYFQESTRFAVIDESFADRVGLPPSLAGTTSTQDFIVDLEERDLITNGMTSDQVNAVMEANMTADQAKRVAWDDSVYAGERSYKALVEGGMPAEEARGLLPTNLLTRVHYVTDLRNLVGHAGLRLCTQAQFEWRNVFSQIARSIREARVFVPGRADGIKNGWELPVHMADRIADRLFRPVCYATGKCEFMASFDRACSIRDRVEINHKLGRSSARWHEPSYPKAHPGHTVDPSGKPIADAINPAEWLLDDGAARS